MSASGWNYQNLVKWIVGIEAACLLAAGGSGAFADGVGAGGGDPAKHAIEGTVADSRGTVSATGTGAATP